MKSKLLVLSAALMLVLCGCQPKGNDFVPDDNPGGDVTPDVVHVTSVSLNQTSATLNIGDTLTLQATVLPENATNKGVSWSASNGNVSVDEGLVTALHAGTSTVTATSLDGSITASCNITVNAEAVEETINFSGETDKPANTWVYWNDQNWCGSNIEVDEAYTEEGTVHAEYRVTNQYEAWNQGYNGCTFAFQIFYKNTSLTAGASYTLSYTLTSAVNASITANGKAYNLVANTATTISVDYTEVANNASFALVFSSLDGNNTIEFSNISWVAK